MSYERSPTLGLWNRETLVPLPPRFVGTGHWHCRSVARPSSTLTPQPQLLDMGCMSDDELAVAVARPPAVMRRAGQHARATQRRLAHRAIAKVTAAILVLVLVIALLGFTWPTCVIEVGIVLCLVLIDRTASALVGRWGRGAAGEELVGEVLDALRERG